MDKKKDENKKDMYIDIDKAIEVYNEKNPDDKITRRILAERLGCNYQSLTNYQGGKIPDMVGIIDELINLTGLSFCDIVKDKNKEDGV